MKRGFTLVEMIVALAVTSVLTVLMLRMFTDSSTIWKREDDRLDTFREARAALQLMATELSTVNPLPELNPKASEGEAERFPALALRYHPNTPEGDQTTPGNQEIYALAALPNRGKSDLCAIGYYCEWVEAKSCYVLRRQFTDGDETFARLQKVLKASAPISYPASFAVLYNRSVTDNGTGIVSEPVQDLATYVWDLQFTLPAPAATTANPNPPPPKWLDQRIYGRELPQWVEIRFKALGSSAARKLEGQPMGRTDWFKTKETAYQRFILPAEQQFVTRVKLSR